MERYASKNVMNSDASSESPSRPLRCSVALSSGRDSTYTMTCLSDASSKGSNFES